MSGASKDILGAYMYCDTSGKSWLNTGWGFLDFWEMKKHVVLSKQDFIKLLKDFREIQYMANDYITRYMALEDKLNAK